MKNIEYILSTKPEVFILRKSWIDRISPSHNLSDWIKFYNLAEKCGYILTDIGKFWKFRKGKLVTRIIRVTMLE